MGLPRETRYTCLDFLEGTEQDREELIDGYFYRMAGTGTAHQMVLGDIYCQLANYLRGKKCRVFSAPYDVRLFEKKGDRPEQVDTVVEPDISVICDPDKIDERGCAGAPDLVVEVLSPSSRRHDRLVKFNLYQRAGVREYWIVDPAEKVVETYYLEDGRYFASVSGGDEKLRVRVLEDCVIDLGEVFAQLSNEPEETT